MTSPAPAVTACARMLLLSAGLALGTGMAAQASTLSWKFEGTIAEPTDDTNGVFSGGGTDTLYWGDPDDPATGTPIDSLSISNEGVKTENFNDAEEKEILLGWLDYENRSVFGAGGTWTTTLALSIELNSEIFNPNLLIEVENTPDPTELNNVANNLARNNTTGLNPDHITFLNNSLSGLFGGAGSFELGTGSGFWVEGYDVRLDIAGAAGDGSPRQAIINGQTVTLSTFCGFGDEEDKGSLFNEGTAKWSNCEGNDSRLGLYLTVSYKAPPPSVIPLPAAGWLLLGGLGALGAAAARRRRAA
jgi:hypothetical protein